MPRFSGRLHAVFIIFANQREHIFCYTRFCRVIFSVQIILKKSSRFWGGNPYFGVNRQWKSVVPKLESYKSRELRSR